jgi:TolB-like protein/Flp pilus assembly protein TadD
MSPEQVRGLPADERSDIFSFGCVMYEMAVGRRPFLGQTTADTMAAILHELPTDLSQSGRDRPAELDRLIMRCLQKNPAERFQSARDVALALRNLGQTAVTGAAGQHPLLETAAYLESPPPSAAPPRAPSLAVLPFRNMSSDPENEFFSDGLAEELINALTKVAGLRVASRTSSFAFRGKNEDVRKIGEQLNVRTVLEGSVRKSGNRLRISAQLVDVADGYHVWSETYNRELQDVFSIQDEIAHSITTALKVILSEKEKRAIERAPTADVRAYEYYLRGRQFVHQMRHKAFEFALDMFARAVAIDPGFALAFAGIADCHSFLYMYFDTSPANLQKADDASRKALELDPDLAEAHVARCLAVSLKKDYAEAEREFQTAIRLAPTLFEAHYFYGRTCYAQGKYLEAAHLFEQACQLRPDDYQAAAYLGMVFTELVRNADAEAATRRAVAVVSKHVELHPDDPRALHMGAILYCRINDSARGLEWAGRALAIDPEEPVTLYAVACVYALQRQVDRGLDCLESAVKHGWAHKEWIERDSDLASLRGHARYQALVQSLASTGGQRAGAGES